MIIKVNYTVSDIYIGTTVSAVYIKVVYSGVSAGGGTWGTITGTLSAQTDLQNALDAKFDDPTGTTSQYLRGDGSLATFPSIPGGTVTSVGLSMPSALTVGSSPITSSGTIAVTGAGTTLQYIDGTGALQTLPTRLESDSLVATVRNQSGATMTKGTIVYISGATGNKPLISKALATGDATSAQTLGLLQTDIANNADGHIVIIGNITDINTSALTEGQQLYLSGTTAGTWTTTKPYAPIHLVYVGIVIRSHPTQGTISVKIQNGFEMDELHDVSAQSPANNDGLFWNSTTSLWSKNTIGGVLGYTPVPTSRTLTINGTTLDLSADRSWTIGSMAIGGAITSATAGSVLFAGTSGVLQQDNANFFWDDTNKRLAIGRNSAASKLDIQGNTASDVAVISSELTTTGSGTNWTGTSFATGYTHTAGSTAALTTTLSAIPLAYYQLSWTITGRTTGTIVIVFGNYNSGPISATSNIQILNNGLSVLSITPTTDFNGTIVMSIKLITPSTSVINLRNSTGAVVNEFRASSINTNLFTGINAGQLNTTGGANTAYGQNALSRNTTGYDNNAIGTNALFSNTTGFENTAIGAGVLGSNTTGYRNMSLGVRSMVNNSAGSDNVAIGVFALNANTNGGRNTAIGAYSLRFNSNGEINTAIGHNAMYSMVNGSQNTATGWQSMYLSIGSNNSAYGSESLLSNQSGNNNTSIGWQSLQNANSSNNIALGYRAGKFISGGVTGNGNPTNSLFLGYNTKALADSQTNQIVIGYDETGLGSNTTIIGNSSTITTALRGRLILGTLTDSGLYQLDVNGTARVSGDMTINGVLLDTTTTNRQTASYSLVLADRGKLVEMNVATANNLTIPLNSSIAFPIGSKIDVTQYGAGQTTIVATGGVTIRSTNGWLKLNAQYAAATLIKIATDEWYLIGNLNA